MIDDVFLHKLDTPVSHPDMLFAMHESLVKDDIQIYTQIQLVHQFSNKVSLRLSISMLCYIFPELLGILDTHLKIENSKHKNINYYANLHRLSGFQVECYMMVQELFLKTLSKLTM